MFCNLSARLHDIQTNLKTKLEKQEKLYQDDNQQLADDYKRITEQYLDLQRKSKYILSAVIFRSMLYVMSMLSSLGYI